MLDLVFVSLRETAEIALLLFALASYRPKERRYPATSPDTSLTNGQDTAPGRLAPAQSLRFALVAGAIGGFLPGLALPFLLSINLDAIANALLDLLFGLFLLSMAVGVLATNARIIQSIDAVMERWVARLGWPLAVGSLAALLTFRESFEIAFFALRRVDELGWAATAAAISTGAVLVAVLPLAGLLLRVRLPLNTTFRISALLLAWFAVGMVVSGLLALGEAGIAAIGPAGSGEHSLPDLNGPLRAMLMAWPIYALLRDWWRETGPADRTGGGGRIA